MIGSQTVTVRNDGVHVQTAGQRSIYSEQALRSKIMQFPRVDHWKHYLNLLLESRAPRAAAQPQTKESAE